MGKEYETGSAIPDDEGRSIRVSGQSLRRFTADVFVRCRVPEEDAIQAADVLCTADEWGISSHGVARLRAYYEMCSLGRINPQASPRVVRESPTVSVVDGDNGLGLAVAPKANRIAMEKAEAVGTAWVSVFHSNHFGIAGYYTAQGIARDLISWAMTNTPALVSPLWGVGRVLGTNPISVAIPAYAEPPVIIDMATSGISLGVAENARRHGRALPLGCIIDSEGQQTAVPAELFSGGSLLPLGGDREHGGHKGYCLAALVDILCGVLSGSGWGPFVPPFPHDLGKPVREVGQGIGHLFGAFRIDTFTEAEEFKRRMDDWIRSLRSTPPMPNTMGVQIPGDPERRAAADAAAHGLALAEPVAADLQDLAQHLGLRFD